MYLMIVLEVKHRVMKIASPCDKQRPILLTETTKQM